ncbi:MAG: hypothetical protein ACR2G0_00525 [Chthoniobacterales bacterium]
MRPLLVVLLAFLIVNCAQDQPASETVREHFARGVAGEGEVVPLDHEGQPNLNPPVTQSAPNP